MLSLAHPQNDQGCWEQAQQGQQTRSLEQPKPASVFENAGDTDAEDPGDWRNGVSRRPSPVWLEGGIEPRNDGFVSHQPLAITVTAVMASRQLPKGWNDKTRTFLVISKAGETELIGSSPHPTHWMQMTTNVEQIRLGRGFWSVAQPELPKPLGRLLAQPFEPGVTIMIAPDQLQQSASELRQDPQHLTQPGRDALSGMNQIAQHKQLLRPQSVAQIKQRIDGSTISIARKWNAMGLKRFCFAEMQIGHKQNTAFWPPEGTLGKKLQAFPLPRPGLASHQMNDAPLRNAGCIGMAGLSISIPPVTKNYFGALQASEPAPHGHPELAGASFEVT
jgi:hypothetical protein